ncbi:MAG: DNA-3-methyladenine glycosylase I [Pseudomonadota bacterium]
MSETPADGLLIGPDGHARCWWHGGFDDYTAYHDSEWGRPVDDDRRLFEKICLEGFQAGLSWLTILRKRENFRKAFANFEFEKVADFTEVDVERLLNDAGIIRHRGKIEATINNAQRALDLVEEKGSVAAYVWGFEPDVSERPTEMTYDVLRKLTTSTSAKALSKDLKKRGWRFVGPTTVYSFMQAMGLVNDHLEGCFVREQALAERHQFQRP